MAEDRVFRCVVLEDVLDPFIRSVPFTVMYRNRLVVNGCELKPSAIVNRPRAEVGGDDLRVLYTLVMVDPDAPNPSNPTLKEYLHWMVTDIPATTNATFGRELVCYENPQPASGIHRMVFVLFRQIRRETVYAPEFRPNFSTKSFALQHYLTPVAVAYFNCQRETGSGGRRFRPEDVVV